VSAFEDLADIAPHAIWPGLRARVAAGERVTFSVIELDPDIAVPRHAHDHEQIGVLVSGSVRFRIGDEEQELEEGRMWRIPPNVPHSVEVGSEGAIIVEVFAPARDDWEAVERLEPSPPLWPVRSGRL
jgi:quercetin dioxygenase-like cupin family protein